MKEIKLGVRRLNDDCYDLVMTVGDDELTYEQPLDDEQTYDSEYDAAEALRYALCVVLDRYTR